jgi:hypothetical protein
MVNSFDEVVKDLSADDLKTTAVFLHSTADAAKQIQRCEDNITRVLRDIANRATTLYCVAVSESERLNREMNS